jgi:hypothetical protein
MTLHLGWSFEITFLVFLEFVCVALGVFGWKLTLFVDVVQALPSKVFFLPEFLIFVNELHWRMKP